ncbi:MAG: methylated-DNA--[protein]-cysteine S-methyltransferase [Thermodesulfobacteriota bacterium]
MFYRYLDSPIGRLFLAGNEGGLKLISFPNGKKTYQPEADWKEKAEALSEAARQLSDYFEGKRKHFDLKLSPAVTPFQGRVLQALQEVPYGETVTYGELARRIGQPNAARAVGMANARNPIPIVIPCHRVIGKSGKLTGFGGGLDIKQRLLDLEQGLR